MSAATRIMVLVLTCLVAPACDDGASGGDGDADSDGDADGDSDAIVAACDDGEANGDETDVDCGGSCEACAAGLTCEGSEDCAAGLCLGRTCSPADAPLLAPGQHVTIQPTYAALSPELQAVVDSNWAEAKNRGMDIARTMHDWAGLDLGPGNVDLTDLIEELDGFQSEGLQVFLTLPIVDSGEFVMPEDLLDPDDDIRLADGMALDDPVVVQRLTALLDEVVPVLIDHDVFALSLTNEPDAFLEDSFEHHQPLINLVSQARHHVRSLTPDLAVTATVTFDGLNDSHPLSSGLADESDILAVNWYCASFEGSVKPPEQAAVDLDAILANAGPRHVFIQEFGCHSGFDGVPSHFGASLEHQRDWYVAAFEAMAARPRIRGAAAFQMLDMAPEIWALYEEWLIGIGIEGEGLDIIREAFVTLGIVRYDDGTPKLAWPAFLDGVELLSTGG